jgi:hypothetical protein
VVATPLVEIARTAGFPDWLGYLGIVLREVEADRPSAGELTVSWIPQLIALGGNEATWRRFVEPDLMLLKWSDLEQAEAERIGDFDGR